MSKIYIVNETYDSFGGNDIHPIKAFSTLDKARKFCESLPEIDGRKRIGECLNTDPYHLYDYYEYVITNCDYEE